MAFEHDSGHDQRGSRGQQQQRQAQQADPGLSEIYEQSQAIYETAGEWIQRYSRTLIAVSIGAATVGILAYFVARSLRARDESEDRKAASLEPPGTLLH
jgi:hypothetical protein